MLSQSLVLPRKSYWVHGCVGWSFVCQYLCSLSPSFKRFCDYTGDCGAMMLAEAVEISWVIWRGDSTFLTIFMILSNIYSGWLKTGIKGGRGGGAPGQREDATNASVCK